MSDVPEGYKMSEVGVIPEAWEVKMLGDVVDFLDGRRKPIKDSDRAKMRGIYPYYGASGIIDYVNDYIFDENLILLGEDGDNILSRNSKLAFQISGKVWINNHAHVLRPKSNTDITFLTEYLESPNYELFNTGTAQPKLNKKVSSEIPILSPPLPEQQAIASALSDVDALITALEQLITKKRNIKQGAMQQLLTGKKRLPGFGGAWEVKKLGEKDISAIDPDNLNSNTNPNYSFKYISLEDVEQGILKSYTECIFSSAPSRARRKVQKNDILFGTVRPNLKSHLFIKNNVADLICSTGFSVIRTNIDTVNAEFIFHHLFANDIERQINTLLSGSNYPAINGCDVKSLQIPFPPLPEQTAIAQILSDMDTEIESLEQKRDKYKAIKQGMMQELLTGKRRLA